MLLVTLHLWPALQQAGGWPVLGLFHPCRLPSPPTPGLGPGTPGLVDSAMGRELIGFVMISLPKLAPCQTHPVPGKRALFTSPGPALRNFGCPQREDGTEGPRALPPSNPAALGSPELWWGQGPASPPMVSSAGFPSTRPGQRSWGCLPGQGASTLTTRPGTSLGLVERCF